MNESIFPNIKLPIFQFSYLYGRYDVNKTKKHGYKEFSITQNMFYQNSIWFIVIKILIFQLR